MKRLLLPVMLAALSCVQVYAQNSTFRVFLGTFVNANLSNFQNVRGLGFVYATEKAGNYYDVYLGGGMTSVQEASQLAQQARGQGYLNARAENEFPSGNMVYSIQLVSLNALSNVDWNRYIPAGDLYFFVQGKTIKLGAGSYIDINAARAEVARVRTAGFSGAFVKGVDQAFLHPVGRFELNGVKKDLIPIAYNEPGYNPNPQVRTRGIEGDFLPGDPAPNTDLPNIRGNIRRNSVYELQKVLKAEGVYTGSLDGYYGPGTGAAYRQFVQQNRGMQQYAILAANLDYSINTGPNDALQQAISNLATDPNRAYSVLQSSIVPVAFAYRAYYLLVSQGPSNDVNRLMNEALRRAYSGKVLNQRPPIDFNAVYAYPDLTQLLSHLQYVHSAPDNPYVVPCWLFTRHGREMASARSGFIDYANDSYGLENCESFTDWEEIRMLIAVAEDLGGRRAQDDINTLTRNSSRRTKLFFLEGPFQYPDAERRALQWYQSLIRNLDAWAGRDPLHQKLLLTFKTTFYQSLVRLEDFYMDKGYSQRDAKTLAIATMNTLVSYQLERFV